MSTKITTGAQLAAKAKDVVLNYKTLYVMGCFGAPMNATNKKRYCSNHTYNKAAARQAMINAASADTFGFDCVCLIKGLLWGWCGDKNKVYGGAGYAVNGVPDIGADSMIGVCKDVSTDFSKIEVGEAVWCKGHIGIYIGGGYVIEAMGTRYGVVKTALRSGSWTGWCKNPYINYVDETAEEG